MCGIVGILDYTSDRGVCAEQLVRMRDVIAHRGPDGEGFFLEGLSPAVVHAGADLPDQPTTCALGHRRLAIIDPAGGAQPMVDEDGRVAALLNGEIYNFRELRVELEREGCRRPAR